jgi:hypothetical protein
MKSFRRLALGLVGSSLALAGGATAWMAGAEAATAATTHVQPRLPPNGVGFSIHSEVDTNFYAQDTPAPGNPASEASMSQCPARNGQDWTFAHAADGSVLIIGGNTGNCLDFSAAVHASASMTPRTSSAAEHFSYSPEGQIKSTTGNKCLPPEAATQGGELFIAKCNKTVALQVFMLTH